MRNHLRNYSFKNIYAYFVGQKVIDIFYQEIIN